MRSILISIKPQWVAKILNGEKTIEVRKTAPKCELPIEVYIYCTKTIKPISNYDWGEFAFDDLPKLGKIVAKFTLRAVHKFDWQLVANPFFKVRGSCLTYSQLKDYATDTKGKIHDLYGWQISDLKIFDEPKELDEFDYPCPSGIRNVSQRSLNGLPSKKHPPRSWFYVEGK